MRVRREMLFVLLAGTAACGGFLGFGGDDEDVPAPAAPSADASTDAPSTSDATGASDAPSVPDVAVEASKDGSACNFPPCERWVFATSTLYTGNLGGLAGADGTCMERAGEPGADARLKGRTFVAYLSTPAGGAGTRLLENRPAFRRLDGQVVADDTQAFINGPLKAAINRDERNMPITGDVWTGTLVGGQFSDDDCDSWNDESSLSQGTTGTTTATANPNWVNAGSVNCAESRRLYCVEP